MSKCLKKYNEVTKQWETIQQPQAEIIRVIDINDSAITDNDVVVTNSCYSKSESGSTLHETLSDINDDISRLQRNVSWLAEHGGGGSGGGGGTTGYGIVMISVNDGEERSITDKTVYVNNSTVSIKFMITGGTLSDVLQYRYTFDGSSPSDYINVGTGEYVTIKIENINSIKGTGSHTFLIEAINPYGLAISPYSLTINETTLRLELMKDQPSKQSVTSGNEITLAIGENGLVYFYLTNATKGAETSLIIEFGQTSPDPIKFINKVTTKQEVSFSLWSFLKNPIAGSSYVFSVYAQSVSGSFTNKTEPVIVRAYVRSPNDMAIYLDNITYLTDVDPETFDGATEFAIKDSMYYGFKAYLPQNSTSKSIYYAAKISTPSYYKEEDKKDYLVLGAYFDENLHSETATSFLNNPATTSGLLTSSQWYLNPSDFDLVKGWTITVKAWSIDGTKTATTVGVFNIIENNGSIYDSIIPSRSTTQDNQLTCLASWNKNNVGVSKNIWKSVQKSYSYACKYLVDQTVSCNLTAYGVNGTSSGLIKDVDVPYLRLQNNTYAIADFSEYDDEIAYMTSTNAQNYGFTVSITFIADEYAYKNRTIMLMGTNDSDGVLSSGMKIDLENAYWALIGEKTNKTIKANIRQNTKNTIDFVYDGVNAKIYVNGILNAIEEVGAFLPSYTLPNKIYLGCNYYKSSLNDYSDVSIFDLSVYTMALDELEIVINSKNARLSGRPSNPDVIADYEEWKRKNLFDTTAAEPINYIYDKDGRKFESLIDYNYLKTVATIPIIRITADNDSYFTEEYFYDKKHTETGTTSGCTIEYYDPANGKSVSFIGKVSLQGTSTLGYRVKNLEIYTASPIKRDPLLVQLFQPRKDWFPESQFTLKADIVDSAHANNATLGYWINHYTTDIMETNPAQDALTVDTRPKDIVGDEETPRKHTNNAGTDEIDYDEDVTIKHTLEGFPVILFIQFDGKQTYDLIGIYSFNLGRYSYYNMGMKFLKSFSRRDIDNPSKEVSCPAMIDSYVEYGRDEKFGDIKVNGIFSFEFGSDADDNTEEHPTWTQDDLSVIKHYGSFKFNGETGKDSVGSDDIIWTKLQELFALTARISISNGGRNLGTKYKYIFDGSDYKATSERYIQDNSISEKLPDMFSIENGMAYFTIVNAFGMVDSLGKNLTLRTWNAGDENVKWWPCFYDMDTALALNNFGEENTAETALIDKIQNMVSEIIEGEIIVTKSELNPNHTPNIAVVKNQIGDKYAEEIRELQINKDYSIISYIFDRNGKAILDYTYDLTVTSDNPDFIVNGSTFRPTNFGTCNLIIKTTIKNASNDIVAVSTNEYSLTFSDGGQINTYVTIMNYELSQFGSKRSKLWAILRDTNSALYNVFGTKDPEMTYNSRWTKLRIKTGPLSSHNNFIELMESQISGCGELVYDYDYDSKYVKDTSNLKMLHGQRIEYIRNWLKNRFYFLDGVFENKRVTSSDFDDSPFYKDAFTFTNAGHIKSQMGYIPYTFRTNAPMIIKVNTGSNGIDYKYFVDSYTDTELRLYEHSSAGKQTSIYGSSVIVKLDGLNGTSLQTMNTTVGATDVILPSLIKFDISNSDYLSDDPLSCEKVFINPNTNYSSLETINVSNTSFENPTTSTNFELYLKKFKKVTEINAENSCVSFIAMPNSILTKLNIAGSNIKTFDLSNQTLLKTINFTDCNKLTTIIIDNCYGLETLYLSGLMNLQTVTITKCESLKEVVICDISTLEKITLLNNPSLENITIENCTNDKLDISISIESVKTLKLNGLETDKSPNFNFNIDDGDKPFKNLTFFDCSDFFKLKSLKFNNIEQTYEVETDSYPIVDISRFVNLQTIKLSGCNRLQYVRVPNIEGSPIEIDKSTFSQSTSIKRIFGNLALTTDGVFSGLKSFKLNDEYSSSNINPSTNIITFVNRDDFTNITICTTDMTGMFSKTQCDLSDVYYILKQCSEVTTLKDTFRSTNVVVTTDEPFDNDTFKHCGNVTNIDFMFYDDSICCVLTDELLAPLNKLVSFNSVFSAPDFYSYAITDKGTFFPVNNAIKSISDFNPVIVRSDIPVSRIDESSLLNDGNIEGTYKSALHIDILLSRLSNIERMIGSFNYLTMLFNENMLVNIPYVRIISDSFNKVWLYDTTSSGDECVINNIFNSTSITHIANSFSFNVIGPGENTKNGYRKTLKIGITDSFLNSVSDGIVAIGGYYDTSNNTYNYTATDKNGIFSETNYKGIGVADIIGSGIKKVIEQNTFPYNILNSCQNLKCCSSLFSGLEISENYPINDIKLPLNIFSGTHSLQNVSYLFSNMKIQFTLTPNGFDNTKIENVNGLFNGCLNLTGYIPYHMFYNKNKSISEMDYCFANLGTKVEPYICTQDVYDTYANEYIDSEYGFNTYLCDGTNAFFNMVTGVEQSKIDAFKLDNNIVETVVVPTETKTGIKYTNIEDILSKQNYMCPPDLLKYCSNKELYMIGMFMNSHNDPYLSTEGQINGFKGRIPKDLFNGVLVTNLTDLFSGCAAIVPDKFGSIENVGGQLIYTYGNTYPVKLLDGLSVSNITNMFARTIIWGLTYIPSMFNTLGNKLIILNGTWYRSVFVVENGSDVKFSPNIFNSNARIENIGSMLSYARNLYINYPLFNKDTHKSLREVSSYMKQVSLCEKNGCKTIITPFWNDFVINNYTNCYASDIFNEESAKGLYYDTSDGSNIPNSYRKNNT